jgi:hypothetical protein
MKNRWIFFALTLVMALLVYFALDRLTAGRSLIPHPVPKAFVPPPPPQRKEIPEAPGLAPQAPPPPVFPWESHKGS